MRGYLILLIVGSGLLASVRSRYAAFLLYTWYALFRPQEWSYNAITEYRLSAIVALALIVPSVMTGVLPNLTHPLSLGPIVFLLLAVAAQLNLPSMLQDWTRTEFLTTLVVVSSIGVTLMTSRRRVALFVALMAASLGVHGAWTGLLYLMRGGGPLTVGIGGSFSDNNPFALALTRVVFMLFFAAQTFEWRWARPAFGMMIPFTLATIVNTYSRGAFLALAVSGSLFGLLQKRRGFAIAALCFAAFFAAILVPTGYLTRLNSIGNYEEDGSASGRLHFWRVAVVMANDNPLGVGLGNFERRYDQYDFSFGEHGTRRAVHSYHFQALAETGYAGFVLFEGMLLYSLWALWRVRRWAMLANNIGDDERRSYLGMCNALIASTVAFIVGGTFLSQVMNDLSWLTFAAIAGLHRVAARELAPSTEPATVTPPALSPDPAYQFRSFS